jgi:hypothetical protein
LKTLFKTLFILTLSCVCAYSTALAQAVQLTAAPQTYQLYTRNLTTNQAQVNLQGNTPSILYSNVIFKVFKNGMVVNSQTQNLNFASGNAPFSFNYTIEGGLHTYDFKIYLDNFISQPLVYAADSVACGDAIVIYGQSNAVARSYSGSAEPTYTNGFVRSYGFRGNSVGSTIADTSWYIAKGDGGNFGSALIGQWALVMAKQLIDQHQVPLAIINGAYPGAPIANLLPDTTNATNPATHYGRLMYRLEKAQITTPRALIFYQGESDGDSTTSYQRNFNTLYNSLNNRFASLEKIYIFQVHPFCKQYISGASLRLRNLQRTLNTLPKVTVMSTSAITDLAFDSCHYTLAGNVELGTRIGRLIAHDLYQNPDTANTYPPNIKRAYICHPNRKAITLEFDKTTDTLLMNDPKALRYFIFENDTNNIINQYNLHNNAIDLVFNTTITAPTISYDAPSGYHHPYYITNARNIGALAFYGVPIQPYTPETIVTNLRATPTDSGSVVLTWQTTAEQNNQGFYVQEWVSDSNYITIDSLTAQNTPTNYSYTITNLFKGTYAYRLMYTHNKKYYNTFTDSVQARVQRYNLPPIFIRSYVYPHPIHDYAKLVLVPKRTEILTPTLYNALGQKVREFEKLNATANQNQLFNLDFTNICPAIYYLSLQGSSTITTLRLVVQ